MRNEIASFLAASFGLTRETGDFRGATAVLEVGRGWFLALWTAATSTLFACGLCSVSRGSVWRGKKSAFWLPLVSMSRPPSLLFGAGFEGRLVSSRGVFRGSPRCTCRRRHGEVKCKF